ncbi:wall-associated receptor kinase 3-like [Magnolia sinica]|uniref:wall-associated receptor kinase 3-like n=1 Tax=Magnolia sinica TaxID=86752 RepID=UPI0026587801|nr:wall-associated receptor kinase 3-like [Magnolia sinica]
MVALFCFIIFLSLTHLSSTNARPIDSPSIADCPKQCGDVKISYPFGIGYSHCFFKGFEVNCSQNIPYLPESKLQLLEILQGEVRINSTEFIAKFCPSSLKIEIPQITLSEARPYTISATSNKFIAIGCNTMGMVTSTGELMSSNRCYSNCPTKESIVNGSCKHIGCCEARLLQVRKELQIYVTQFYTNFSECSYGFFVEDGSYIFRESDLLDFDKTAKISTRLEWSIGGSCFHPGGAPAHICADNTSCANTSYGYRCTCLNGYKGNPYLYGSQGCQGTLSLVLYVNVQPGLQEMEELMEPAAVWNMKSSKCQIQSQQFS